MNSVVRERLAQIEADRREWRRDQERKNLESEIMREARFFEDHGDAVERSEDVHQICSLLQEVHSGVRTPDLRLQLSFFREQLEDEISGIAFEGH